MDNRISRVGTKNDKIEIDSDSYVIEAELGRGASCICYRARDEKHGQEYAIKEFYPIRCVIRTENGEIKPKEGKETEFEKAQDRFDKAKEKHLEIQKEYRNQFLEELAIKNIHYSKMPMRDGLFLEDWVKNKRPEDTEDDDEKIKYIFECLERLKDLCEELDIYQSKGYIHMDVKPQNIVFLTDHKEEKIVRLIDFDSLLDVEELKSRLDNRQPLNLYATVGYYGYELWASDKGELSQMLDGDGWKKIDVYALGKIFRYMLTGEDEDDSIDGFTWFKRNDIIQKENILRKAILGFYYRLTAYANERYSDAKTVQFVIENIEGLIKAYEKNEEWFPDEDKYESQLAPSIVLPDGSEILHKRNAFPLEQVLALYPDKNIQYIGSSGMGKSTAMRRLLVNKLLENQTKYRYCYYPLKSTEFKDEEKSNRFWQKIDREYNYSNDASVEYVYFLDAFDEIKDINDKNETTKEITNAVQKVLNISNKRFVLTSRFEVSIESCKCVTAHKISYDASKDEVLQRIAKNSPWIENYNGNIFENPMFIKMARDCGKLEDYVKSKGAGDRIWKIIEGSLLGEYVDGKLRVNYAGELIWNYIHISILSQFADAGDKLTAALEWLENPNLRDTKPLGHQSFFVQVDDAREIWEDCPPEYLSLFDGQIYNNILDELYFDFLFSKVFLNNSADVVINDIKCYPGYIDIYYLTEITGCCYNVGDEYHTISADNLNKYYGVLNIPAYKDKYREIRLSKYQEKHRFLVYDILLAIYEQNIYVEEKLSDRNRVWSTFFKAFKCLNNVRFEDCLLPWGFKQKTTFTECVFYKGTVRFYNVALKNCTLSQLNKDTIVAEELYEPKFNNVIDRKYKKGETLITIRDLKNNLSLPDTFSVFDTLE